MKKLAGFKLNRWIVVVILLTGGFSGVLPLADWARLATRPLGGVLGSWGRTLGNLGRADSQLAAENQQLQQQLIRLAEVERENQQLRIELNFTASHPLKTIGADIINYQPDSVRNFIRLNRGNNDGVKVGQAVMAEGRLVGTISTVRENQSEAMLVTDGEFRALAKSLKDQVPGIVKGRPPTGIIMERIPKPQSISSGEIIVTSGLDGQFPPGLIIGKLLSLNSDQEAIFQTGELEPAVDVLKLKLVRIVVE